MTSDDEETTVLSFFGVVENDQTLQRVCLFGISRTMLTGLHQAVIPVTLVPKSLPYSFRPLPHSFFLPSSPSTSSQSLRLFAPRVAVPPTLLHYCRCQKQSLSLQYACLCPSVSPAPTSDRRGDVRRSTSSLLWHNHRHSDSCRVSCGYYGVKSGH